MTSGSFNALCSAAFSLVVTSGGRSLGPIRPHHTVAMAPGRPCDTTVGTSGSMAAGSSSSTASARSLPALTWETTSSGLMDMKEIRCPNRSVTAGEPPL
ncbi:hypothetical protein D3C71_1830020 [compost metagenome]